MIPFPAGAWVRPAAGGGYWEELFGSLPTLISSSGPTETGTPSLDAGAYKFGCGQSGDNNSRCWFAVFDSPSVADFSLEFDIKIRNPDYGLGWKSEVCINYRFTEPQIGGVNVGWPNSGAASGITGNACAIYLRPQSNTAWGIATRFDHRWYGTTIGSPAENTSTGIPHDTWTTLKLTVSGNNHELFRWNTGTLQWVSINTYTHGVGYTDPQYSPASRIGIGGFTIQMFSNNYDSWIDNLKLTY